jgi:magnesium chelatase subunit I
MSTAETQSFPPPQPADVPRTLGELNESGYRYRPVKQELRENALRRVASGDALFPGVVGYEESVTPQLIQGLLSGHDMLLLGLRGQAKTRLLRACADLLDEWVPIISAPGMDIPDDPVHPTTGPGLRIVHEMGDVTPIRWLHRSRRYHEKLATPDVTIADLIGEIDLVKHAEGRYLSDEATIHFGLVPRSNRGLFVINELPDLPPRIQVGLFNVLEERDVQIRGYPVRMELDLCLMFSANPEDYTNRGRIVTPLKDRIGSVVRTHYPLTNTEAMRITRDNAFVRRSSGFTHGGGIPPVDADPTAEDVRNTLAPKAPEVDVPPVMHEILEEMIRQARRSAHVNQASGVSVRASIAALECLVSAAEMRAMRTGVPRVVARPCDTTHIAAAMRGKIELMIAEDSPDGSSTEDRLIHALLGEAMKSVVEQWVDISDVEHIAEPFSDGLRFELDDTSTDRDVVASMKHVDGLLDAAMQLAADAGLDAGDEASLACAGELVLEFLYVNNRLSKRITRGGSSYSR